MGCSWIRPAQRRWLQVVVSTSGCWGCCVWAWVFASLSSRQSLLPCLAHPPFVYSPVRYIVSRPDCWLFRAGILRSTATRAVSYTVMCQSFFRVDAHECRACNEKWTTKRGVSKDMGGMPWWARTWRQRALGRSNGQPCPLVLSPVPPYSSPALPLAHPVVRLLNEEDKETKEMWLLTTWEEPKCASRKDAERTSPLPPASTRPPDPPSHRGVAWVLAGVSFLIQFKQCRHDAHLPFCFCMSPGQGVARWVLWSSTLQLGVCRSAVGGDVHN